MADSINLDTMLSQKTFVLLEAVNQVFLLETLLPASGRLRRNDTALNLGLDAVGTGLVLVAANLALLTEYTAGAPGQLDSCRVERRLLLRGRARHTGDAIGVGHLEE
jgi:hypothetical protein